MIQTIQTVALCLSLFLNVCSVAVIIYNFKRFLDKPKEELQSEVEQIKEDIKELRVKQKETEESLKQGNDKFRELAEANKVFISCMLSFLDFEIAYCYNSGYKDSEALQEAKKTLNEYLKKK